MCVRKMKSEEGERRERDGEGAEKEDRRFNNSQTPASFRIESVPKPDPCVLHVARHPQRLAHSQTLCLLCVCAVVQELAKG